MVCWLRVFDFNFIFKKGIMNIFKVKMNCNENGYKYQQGYGEYYLMIYGLI